MRAVISRFVKDESGATAIEYALIAGLLSVAVIGTLLLVSGQLVAIWAAIQAALASAQAG